MIQYISKPFKYFFKLESASGLVLLFAAVIALFISNSSLGENYFKILESYFTLGTEDFGLKLSVLHWINDVLMAIFFFLVSLEIKREFVKGELSNPKQAMLPIIGAVGGMVVPAAIYIIINIDDHKDSSFAVKIWVRIARDDMNKQNKILLILDIIDTGSLSLLDNSFCANKIKVEEIIP